MRILVVENEIKLAKAIKRALELQKYAVDIVHDGAAGYALATEESFDLILLDLMLPEMDGVTVCRKLRKKKVYTPILMLTAKGQVEYKIAGLDTGADDYMVKPFSFDELFSRIRAILRRGKNNLSPTLQVHNLSLDPRTFKVRRGKKSIRLSNKEFSILEYLLRNKNKVVSKQEIVDHVWNYQTDILPSTIEVHIKNLRDKIGTRSGRPLIETVRGFGYEIRESGT